MSNTVTFGDANSGFQAGIINGPVSVHANPDRLETPPNPSILIPFSRDKDFVEREGILDKIHQSCGRPGSRTALVGLGGVGKSQLAIEYSYRTRERSSETWVFWVHASNAARFEQSFRDIASCVKIFGRQILKANIFQLVHDWLHDERKGNWVIVLDNVDDAGFLKLPSPSIEAEATKTKSVNSRQLMSYVPHCQHGSVLITSRSRGAALELVEYTDIIAIEPMNDKDALQLFQNKLGLRNADACTAELAAALEHMPLAIVQAAAYILRRGGRYSVRKYLDEFRKSDRRKADLLGYEGGKLRRDAEAKNSILITWQISFNYIRQTRPSAADMLSLMSFCDRQGIPEILLRSQNGRASSHQEQEPHNRINDTGDRNNHHCANDDDNEGIDSDNDSMELQSNYSENDRFEDDIMTLRDYSFILVNEDRTTFEMHRLVQLATLEWLESHGIQDQWRHRLLQRLCTELPIGEHENWAKCQVLFPHAQSVAARRPDAEDSIREWATILHKAAWYAWRMGRATEAENLSIQAMKARKKLFGAKHKDVVESLLMVAMAYNLSGRWAEAEELQVNAMETCKKTLGDDHGTTVIGMMDLASTYWNQGRLEAAEELLMPAIETAKKTFGEDGLNTLRGMNNLASIYRNQGRLEAAEELEVQVTESLKKGLGEYHPDTLTSVANLASTYKTQGRWEAAEKLEVQVIETLEKKFGKGHPDTLRGTNNLAVTYRNQGRLEEAEKLGVQVTEMSKGKLGRDHPNTLRAMCNLASTYLTQGRLEEAEELFMQVTETFKKKLGQDHPDTLKSMTNLALTYWNQGRWGAAEELGVQVMRIRKKKLGDDHPDTLSIIEFLALVYVRQGRSEAAEELGMQVIEIQ